MILETNDDKFQIDVLECPRPVLVVVSAPWCQPCKALAPILEEVERENKGRIRIVKADIEISSGVAAAIGARSVPTLAVYDKGKMVAIHPGSMHKRTLQQWLDTHLL